MTRGPRRLKDDPDFQWETGCNLADEESRVGRYDLPALRERVVAAALLAPVPLPVAEPPPVHAPPAWHGLVKPAAGLVTGALVVAAAYWLGVQAGSAPSSPAPAPPVAPVQMEAPAMEPGPVAPTATPSSGTSDETTAAAAPVRPPSAVRAAPALAIPVEGRGDEGPAVGASDVAQAAIAPVPAEASGTAEAETIASAPVQSELALYTAAYDVARGALEEGDFRAGRAGFEALLSRWPAEYLSTEAQMGLLQCDLGLGDAEATVAQAASMQDAPAFAARRAEIVRLRAESLVKLNRCDEALALADQASPRDAAEIRRVCRDQHKE